MPIYEYQCDICHKTHEIWQRITEDPATECPDCGGALTRLISQTSFALQGTGWYKTDYVSGTGGNAPTTPAKAEGAPAATSPDAPASAPAAPSEGASGGKKESATSESKSATTAPKSGTGT